jgi:hypothetical protein
MLANAKLKEDKPRLRVDRVVASREIDDDRERGVAPRPAVSRLPF